MRKQVEVWWQRSELTDVMANVVIYQAFVEAKLEAPKHLARTVHDLYFEPKVHLIDNGLGFVSEKEEENARVPVYRSTPYRDSHDT